MEPLLGGRLANVPDAVVKMMKEHDPEASVASWAFRFTGTYPKVLNVLSGMTRMEHLEDNINTFSPLVPLNDSEQEMLQKAAEIMTTVNNVPCTACQYCVKGCPMEINIPGVFKALNNYLIYNNLAGAKGNFGFATRKGGKPADCISCGQCEAVCPQHISIIEELKRADEILA